MSYILGALKKAEKDRKHDKAVNLENWDQEDWSRPKEFGSDSNTMLFAILSVLMLVLILFSWLVYKVLIMPNQTVLSPTVSEIEQVDPVRMEVIDASSDDVIPVYVEPENTEIPLKTSPLIQRAPVKEASKPKVVSNSAKPIETTKRETNQPSVVRPELPKFSGHIYFPNNDRLSRVFSGPNSYREGDEVEGYLVERIGEGVVVLSFAGKEFRIKLAN